jgi:hypothetical protein
VQVRRFFCDDEAWARKIFAERLPDLTRVYGRRTTRCIEVLTALRRVCQLHPQVKQLSTLFQDFVQVLGDRRGEELDHWLHASFHNGIPELRLFVKKNAAGSSRRPSRLGPRLE